MATEVSRGDSQAFAVVGRARRRNRAQRWWRFVQEWPVLPVMMLMVLLILALLAGTPWWGNVTGFNPELPSLSDRNAAINSDADLKTYERAVARAEKNGDPIPARPHFWLGADQFGRDILTRIMKGAQISLIILSIAASVGMVFGTFYGLAAGYFGGLLDEILMRALDVYFSIPFILLALVAVIVFGQSISVMLVLLALLAWPPFVRNVRAEVLSLKERDYVAAARATGASDIWIMWKHIVPNVINTVIVIATLRVGQLILAEAILSFLGAGVPPPTPTWGAMVAEGRDYLASAWWISFFPGVMIFLLVMSLNFIGDWFRDKFDPRLRNSV
ncbi:MAG: ABC transporter permease [Dehalococcoidia bacterium]|nr:peptide ABC transporter permease [Chloroflexota bacterium]MDP6272719.1 ABC transporter permease [Dehalococcoidia bacterium]